MIPRDTQKTDPAQTLQPVRDKEPVEVSDSPAEEQQDVSTRSQDGVTAAGHNVVLTDLHAYYGSVHAVRGVNITFPPNEVSAIIGPSGCGKSTLVRCINRMHEEIPGARAEGSVTLDDVDMYGDNVDVTSVRRLVGMVFQKPNPFPTMSIFENVAAGLRLTGT